MNTHEALREADRLFHEDHFDQEYLDALAHFMEKYYGQTELGDADYEDMHDFGKHLLTESWNYIQKRVEDHGVKEALIYLLDSYELAPDDEGYNDETDKEGLYCCPRRTV